MDTSTNALLMEGLGLMAVGMSIVFAFLLLLVGMLFAMSWLAARLSPAPAMPEPAGSGAESAAAQAGADRRRAAVIAAVLRYHRDHRGR